MMFSLTMYICFYTGVLIDFISVPVTVGFTSATSVIIAVSQLKGLLGLQFKSGGFIDTVKKVNTLTFFKLFTLGTKIPAHHHPLISAITYFLKHCPKLKINPVSWMRLLTYNPYAQTPVWPGLQIRVWTRNNYLSLYCIQIFGPCIEWTHDPQHSTQFKAAVDFLAATPNVSSVH